MVNVRALWDFDNPSGSLERFESALQSAENPDERLIWQTQIARTWSLRREFDQAHAVLDSIEPETAGSFAEARSYYFLERGRTWSSAGEKAKAQECFLQAIETDVPGLRLDAWHMLAIAQDSPLETERVNREALSLAEESQDESDRRWRGPILNNLGWDVFGAGRFAEALEIFEKAVLVRAEYGEPEPLRIARWCVARCLRELRRHREAYVIQTDLKENGPPDPYVDEELATLCECLNTRDGPG